MINELMRISFGWASIIRKIISKDFFLLYA